VSFVGHSGKPIKGASLQHVIVAHAAPTFMEKFEVPSAGDWAIYRGASVFIETAESIKVEGCFFDTNGGNGVFVSKYARDVVIQDNQFRYLGSSVILITGDPHYYDHKRKLWDMTDLNHPQNTVVQRNVASDFGLVVKQSGGVFHSLASGSRIMRNAFFNGPRSGINWNDQACGGSIVEKNLMFNLVRETLDHGPFNSWDRQPYLCGTKKSSMPPLTYLRGNFIVGGYGGIKGIDHDDGSSAFFNSDNILIYGTQKMKGRKQTSNGNLIMYPIWANHALWVNIPSVSPADFEFVNNTIVTNSSAVYEFTTSTPPTCTTDQIKMEHQKIFLDAEKFSVKCNGVLDFDGWKRTGQDRFSSVQSHVPTVPDMLTMIRRKVGYTITPAEV
jgi:hypothetical protein